MGDTPARSRSPVAQVHGSEVSRGDEVPREPLTESEVSGDGVSESDSLGLQPRKCSVCDDRVHCLVCMLCGGWDHGGWDMLLCAHCVIPHLIDRHKDYLKEQTVLVGE